MATPNPQPPTAAGRTSVRLVEPRLASLLWEPPASDRGSPITGYEVQAEVDGRELAWTLIPGSDADTRTWTTPEPTQGNLFVVKTAQAPASFGDTGLRLSQSLRLRTAGGDTRLQATAPTPRAEVLGGGGRYLRQVQFREANIRLDVTDTTTGRPTTGGLVGPQDFPQDVEDYWAWAVFNNATRRVFGAFFFKDDTTRTTGGTPPVTGDEPYISAWPAGEGYAQLRALFDPANTATQDYTVIVFDPRPGGVSGIGANFDYDTGLRFGARYRWRVRAVNAIGGGLPGPWSAEVIPGASPGIPAEMDQGVRQDIIWPTETTSITIGGAGTDLTCRAQVVVVAPRRGAPEYDEVLVELGNCDRDGAFTPAHEEPLRPVVDQITWETNGHTVAQASATLRAPSLASARALQLSPFMRITTVIGPQTDTLFLGPVDPSKGSIYAEHHQWYVEVTAETMPSRASRNYPTRANDRLTSDGMNPDGTSAARVTGPVGDLVYFGDELLATHIRANLNEVGPMLFIDPREWPEYTLHVESRASAGLLTFMDIAQTAADSLERGWQIAPDGYFRPALNPRFPALVIDPFDRQWNLGVQAVAAMTPRNRRFGVFGPPPGTDKPLAISARHYRVPDGVTADSYIPDDADFDGAQGQVIVEKTWPDTLDDGTPVRMVRLLIYDPGGYGIRAPLPALVDPVLRRVGVVRKTNDAISVREEDENLSDRTERRWHLTPTHLERVGLINAGTVTARDADSAPWNADTAGGAVRSEQSGWRFTVRADIADRVPNPVALEWDAYTPVWQGREIDIAGMGGPTGGMRVARTTARCRQAGLGRVRVEWSNTALQGAELEESMDGLQYLREVRRQTER